MLIIIVVFSLPFSKQTAVHFGRLVVCMRSISSKLLAAAFKIYYLFFSVGEI